MLAELEINSSKREEIINITDKVKDIVSNSRVKEGICVVYAPHASAAIIINENDDPNIMIDLVEALKKLVPKGKWLHDQRDGNGDSHIKSAILGPSETIIIKEGKLLLGRWQDIMLCELDGPRQRKVLVKIIEG